jgi:radical SAM protein with 4Fe4S-binding SPASM domain
MSCSFNPDLTLDEFSERMLAPIGDARFPLSASIELTERCNLSCLHCYINQPALANAVRSTELSTSGWRRIIDQMAEEGTLFLLITGGEPLLREDFEELFIHTRNRGMLVSLFSNATMLTPRVADVLADWGLHSLEVSLYGATPETYEKVTRQTGSFERCLRGIELALTKGFKVSLKTVLLTVNQHELDAMRALTESYGLEFRYDSTLWPRVDGTTANTKYQLSNQAMIQLDLSDPDRREGWEETAQSFEGQLLRAGNVFTCGAGYRSCHIDSRGRMSPCIMVRKPQYNVLIDGFSRAWENLGKVRSYKRSMHTACETCPAAALCTMCPGWSLAIAGDYESIYPPVCEIGLLRYSHFAKQLVYNRNKND